MIPGLNRPSWWLALALSAFVCCYAEVVMSLMEQWSTNPLFSYGFAVPFISGYIAWTKATELRRRPSTPDYAVGIPTIAISACLFWLGHVGGIMILQGTSLIVSIGALVLILFGRAGFKILWFPLAYLVLMLPVWDYPTSQLQVPSQVLSARIALAALQTAGVPALQQGTMIVVPSGTLQVMRECSGINQLVAVVAMVIPAAYLWLDTSRRRAIFIAVAVAIGYLTNGLRIALIGWLTAKGFGVEYTTGPMHIVQGLVVSGIGYLAILGCLSVLSRKIRPDASASAAQPGLAQRVEPPTLEQPIRLRPEASALVLLLLVGAARLMPLDSEVLLSAQLQTFPTRIADWTQEPAFGQSYSRFVGFDDELLGSYPTETGERRFVAVDDELERMYQSRSGQRVRLYIGYYRRQGHGKELTGEASHALAAAASSLTLNVDSRTFRLNEVQRQTARAQRGVLFWYDVNGRVLPSIYRAKTCVIWDALTRGRTNGAIVAVAWDAAPGQPGAVARRTAVEFAQALLPVLRHRLPS